MRPFGREGEGRGFPQEPADEADEMERFDIVSVYGEPERDAETLSQR
jgi:hypothetical protein